MVSAAFTISAEQLALTAGDWREPIAFIDLEHDRASPVDPIRLPCCPVIGVGDASHPLAQRLDAVIDTHSDGDVMAQAVLRQPQAAAVTAQLLRLLPDLSLDHGLTAESLAYATLQGSASHRDWIAARRDERPSRPTGRVGLQRDGDDLVITLDRPEADNAIDRTMRDGLFEAFELAAADTTISRVLLQAAGRAFSLGADLDEFGTTTDPAMAHMIRCATLPARVAARCADRLEVHVNGACVGAGLELAAFARRITASRRAWFQLPELAMGILPGAGGCVSLTRRIGRQRTLLLILSGRRLSARQALEWGLVDEVVD